jgi:hypothetical protein
MPPGGVEPHELLPLDRKIEKVLRTTHESGRRDVDHKVDHKEEEAWSPGTSGGRPRPSYVE